MDTPALEGKSPAMDTVVFNPLTKPAYSNEHNSNAVIACIVQRLLAVTVYESVAKTLNV